MVGMALGMAVLLLIGLVVVMWIERPKRATSVVLVVLDTVRADHCSAYGYERPTTPHLTGLAAEGLLFEQARAVSPWTLPSHASLFTGLLPSQHGCHWEHRWLLDRFDTLAERLAAAKRETFGVTTNANASALWNLAQGFTTFLETWTLRDRHRGLADSGIANAEIDAWLARRDERQPFFLFVNYADAHLPYAPPPPYDRQFGEAGPGARRLAANGNLLQDVLAGKEQVDDADRAGLAALYDGEVRAADARLGELLALLDRHDVADDTLLIVTSDHGEMLGEGGEVDHQLSLNEALLRVPLVVRYPGRVRPARIPEPVALTAIKPWIDEIADQRLPDWSPSPDRTPPALVAQRYVPVDLVDHVIAHGRDATLLARRLSVAWRPAEAGGAWRLERDSVAGERLLHLAADGSTTAPPTGADAMRAMLSLALDEAEAAAPFVEAAGDFAPADTSDARALAQARATGYVAAVADGAVGLHASEHWLAARRATARRDFARADAEFAAAAMLAPGIATILLERAQAADAAAHPDAIGAIERFLQAVGSGSPAPATGVEWAVRRRDELRAERGH